MDVLIYIDELPTCNDTLALAALWLEHMPARVTVMMPAKHAPRLQQAALARLPTRVRGWITFKPVKGQPVELLCEECTGTTHDLLIAAPAGHGRVERLMHSSRISHIVHSAHTSVLVARRVPPAIGRILVGVGTAEHALIDVRVAAHLAHTFQAELTVLHIVSQVPLMFSGLDHMRLGLDSYLTSGLPGVQILASARQIVAETGLTPHIRLREGLVRDELVDEARPYDLLVIGAHTAQGWMSLFLDDITDHVVRYCSPPTLVVRGDPGWI